MPFSFKTVSNALKTVEADVKKGLQATASFASHVATDTTMQSAVEAVTTATFGTSAANLEVQVFNLIDKLAGALQTNQAALVAGLSNAGLDVQTINDFKSIVTQVSALKLS